ncbi:MAG: NUDIX domain-containing protein [Thermodesulfobacteriota bacterium]
MSSAGLVKKIYILVLMSPVVQGVSSQAKSYGQAAQRELAEELGITDEPLRHVFDFYQETDVNRAWGRVYCCCWQRV